MRYLAHQTNTARVSPYPCPHGVQFELRAVLVDLSCVSLITNNHQSGLERSTNSSAEYLFHKHEAPEFNLGDKTLPCGSCADALKHEEVNKAPNKNRKGSIATEQGGRRSGPSLCGSSLGSRGGARGRWGDSPPGV